MRRKKPALDKKKEVIALHNEINEALKTSLPKAIRIGEILADIRSNSKHGEWLPWVKDNLPFSDETARKYQRLYQNREKFQPDWNLTEAYELVLPSRKPQPEAIDINFEEVEPEPDVHGLVYAQMSDSEIEVCELIKQFLDTGLNIDDKKILGAWPDNPRPFNSPQAIYVYPFYDDNGRIYVKTESFFFFDESEEGSDSAGYVEYDKRGIILSLFILYIQRQQNIDSENILWGII